MLAIFWILLFDLTTAKPSPHPPTCTLHSPHHLKCSSPPSPHLPSTIRTLELTQVDEVDLQSIIESFPEIENVSILEGNITSIRWPSETNTIKVLRLVEVGLGDLDFLRFFPKLEVLDVRGNRLQGLGNETLPNLRRIYLKDNPWNCSLDLDWALTLNASTAPDLHNLTCHGQPHPDKNLVTIARFAQEMKSECPDYCHCTLPKVVLRRMGSDHLDPVVEVNCSYRGLTELPLDLPRKSKIIRLEGNEIEDLKPLKHDQVYKRVFDLFLDNNKVKSIEELEGSYFLRHFRVFSISGNKLTEVPTYALDNALEQNQNMPNALNMYLGGNPWRCDCVFTPVFQEMLQKFAPQILDLKEVKCSYVEGDENSLLPIIGLSRSSMCRSPSEYSVQALDLLNGVLASLILLILGKLAYDYYYFKKTGRLPWIVTKMP